MARPSSINMLVQQFGIARLLASISGLVATYPFDDETGVLARVVNPAMGLGRNIVLNPTPSSAASWTLAAGWAYGSSLFTHTPGNVGAASQVIPVTIGKAYQVTVITTGRTAGTVTPSLGASGAAISTNTTTVVNITATSTTLAFTPTTTFDGSISGFSVQQLSEPASSSFSGANLVNDANMELQGTYYWTPQQSALLSKVYSSVFLSQILRVTRNGVNLPGASQSIASAGKTYRYRGQCAGNGTFAPYVQIGSATVFTGTTSTAKQNVDAISVPSAGTNLSLNCTATSGSNFSDHENALLQEIPPMSGYNGNGAAANRPTQQVNAGIELGKAYSFDGNDYVNIYSTDLNGYISPAEFTVFLFAKNGSWAANQDLINLAVDANNAIRFRRTAATTVVVTYIAGGTTDSVTITVPTSGFYMLALTVSVIADQLIAYLNGAQSGATQTGLGTWVGNLATTTAVIGATNTSGTTGYIGSLSYPTLYNVPLTAAQILTIAKAGGVA